MTTFLNLPVELLAMIFDQLDCKSKLRFVSVCMLFYHCFHLSWLAQRDMRWLLSRQDKPVCRLCNTQTTSDAQKTCKRTASCRYDWLPAACDRSSTYECGSCTGCVNRWLPNGEPFVIYSESTEGGLCHSCCTEVRLPDGWLNRTFADAAGNTFEETYDQSGLLVFSCSNDIAGIVKTKWFVTSEGVLYGRPPIEMDNALLSCVHSVESTLSKCTTYTKVFSKNEQLLADARKVGSKSVSRYHYLRDVYQPLDLFTGEKVDLIVVMQFTNYRAVECVIFNVEETCQSLGKLCRYGACCCDRSVTYVVKDDGIPCLAIHKSGNRRLFKVDSRGRVRDESLTRQVEIDGPYCIEGLFCQLNRKV